MLAWLPLPIRGGGGYAPVSLGALWKGYWREGGGALESVNRHETSGWSFA